MRRAAKVDANQSNLVEFFRMMGCSVESLAAVGKGVPDLLIGYRGKNYLVEVKDGAKAPSEQKLTRAQVEWHESWRGQKIVINSIDAAIEFIKSL
jgi:Holliday junction resolvase